MTVIPTQYDQTNILLKIKPKPANNLSNQLPMQLSSPTKKSNDATSAPNAVTPSTGANPYDSNYMDQFTTKMTVKGQILWVDATNLKNSFNINGANISPNSSTNGAKSNNSIGLLLDFNNRKTNANMLDYVHNNDLSHLNKHILDGNYYCFYFLINKI